MSPTLLPDDPYALAALAADRLRRTTGDDRYDAFVVLGSGWATAADTFGGPSTVVPMDALPGFRAPAAEGHLNEIRTYQVAGRRVLAFLGRTHWYEGRGAAAVAHGVRVAAAAGCRVGVLTNANGSLREDWPVGTGVLIADHLNLVGSSPLVGPRFVDLTGAWSARLRAVARSADPGLVEGTYAMLPGPHFETWAEAMWLRKVGADVIGMSTVFEAIAARESDIELLGLSVVTAVEGTPTGVDPGEVVAAAAAVAKRLGGVIIEVIAAMEDVR